MTVDAAPTTTPAAHLPARRGVSRWYAAALAIVGVSTMVFVVANHHIVGDAVRALGRFGPRTIVAAVALVLAGITTRGVQAYVAYRSLGMPARLSTMIRLSAASHAVGKVTKSGGVAGLVPYCGDARRNGRHLGPVVGAYVCMQATSAVA